MKSKFDKIMECITTQDEVYGIAVLLGPLDKFVSDNLEPVPKDIDLHELFDYDEKYTETLKMLKPEELKLFNEQVKTFVYKVEDSKGDSRVTICIHLADYDLIEQLLKLFRLAEVTFYVMNWINYLNDYDIRDTLKCDHCVKEIENIEPEEIETADEKSVTVNKKVNSKVLIRSMFMIISSRIVMGIVLVSDIKWIYDAIRNKNNEVDYSEANKTFGVITSFLKSLRYVGLVESIKTELEPELASDIIKYFGLENVQ